MFAIGDRSLIDLLSGVLLNAVKRKISRQKMYGQTHDKYLEVESPNQSFVTYRRRWRYLRNKDEYLHFFKLFWKYTVQISTHITSEISSFIFKR